MTDATLPADMTVVEISEPGAPEVLVPGKRPVPEAAPGEVLIKVALCRSKRAGSGAAPGPLPSAERRVGPAWPGNFGQGGGGWRRCRELVGRRHGLCADEWRWLR